jgi:hypothetical protein
MKEKIIRPQAKVTKGFMREIVLMPEVLAAIISLFRTIKIRRISMEMSEANGSKRLI